MFPLRSLAVVALVLSVFLGLRASPAPPDLSTPEAAVRSFVKAVSQNDAQGMNACIQTDQPNGEALAALKRAWFPRVLIKELLAETETGKSKVTIKYETSEKKSRVMLDTLYLERVGEGWKIIPQPEILREPAPSDARLPRLVSTIAAMLYSDADSEAIIRLARTKEKVYASLSNAKQIGIAILMYVQDYDETYPLSAQTYSDAILPYVKNKAIFHAPDAPEDEKISYAFNKNLEGLSLAILTDAAKTVMVYEGQNGTPLYRYEGTTVIGLADGSCRAMTEAQVKKLIWNDPFWKPQPNGASKSAAKKARTKTRKVRKRRH